MGHQRPPSIGDPYVLREIPVGLGFRVYCFVGMKLRRAEHRDP